MHRVDYCWKCGETQTLLRDVCCKCAWNLVEDRPATDAEVADRDAELGRAITSLRKFVEDADA
jgi:hypothetical protein